MSPKMANETRQRILEKATEEIHKKGYHAVSINDIIQAADLTKGGFYHHFRSKEELGLAVISELLRSYVEREWIAPVLESQDSLEALKETVRSKGEDLTNDQLRCGCPLNNMAQEVSTTDENMRLAMAAVFQDWIHGFSQALENGQKNGTVRKDLDPKNTATLLVAMLEGCIGLGKVTIDKNLINACAKSLFQFLDSLKP